MSVRVLARVWEHSMHAGTDLLMLLALADFSDDDGRSFPSVAKLASKCRMSPRNAIRLLSGLRDSGELVIHLNQGPYGANLYEVRLPLTSASPPDNRVRVTPASSPPDNGVTKPLTRMSPKPSKNRQEPSTRASKGDTLSVWLAGFDDGDRVFRPDHPVYTYAEKVGLSEDYVSLAWAVYKAKYIVNTKRRYVDWRLAFLNALKAGWLKLWFAGQDGAYALTTSGKQAALEHGRDHLVRERRT